MQADKKEKTRHNHFIKTAQPYKPKVASAEKLCREKDTSDLLPSAFVSPCLIDLLLP